MCSSAQSSRLFKPSFPLDHLTFAHALKNADYSCACTGVRGAVRSARDMGGLGLESLPGSKDYEITKSAVEFIGRDHRRPFCLQVNHRWIHVPIEP